MKSAYERAMERFGDEPIKELTDQQKEQLAEVDSLYKSKMVQAEFAAQERLAKAAGDQAQQAQVRDDLAVELASLRERCERDKNKIRNGSS